jgi:hypothetical protein
MNIDGMNVIATINGYKYFIFSFDTIVSINDNTIVASNINNTIPIASVGPANNGKI